MVQIIRNTPNPTKKLCENGVKADEKIARLSIIKDLDLNFFRNQSLQS